MVIQQSVVQKMINFLLLSFLRPMYTLWKRNNPHSNARTWSNDVLRNVAHLFSGNIINVSAGNDSDKEGRTYRDYFKNMNSYAISNYQKVFPELSEQAEVVLDLNIPLPADSPLRNNYDVVFSHTVLEHVYKIDLAVKNLCSMSRDVVITIVPFIQSFHHVEHIYHDYWRVSPHALAAMFNQSGFETLCLDWNNDPFGNIYIFHIASKQPEKWKNLKDFTCFSTYGPGYGRQMFLTPNSKECANGMIKNSDAYTKHFQD